MELTPGPDPAGLAIAVPTRGVVLLVGASGAGKSTFARRHFAPTEILSSDAFRALVSDDEADQSATPAAFDLLSRVLGHRLRRGRLSVVDATNATSSDRRSILRVAAIARRPAVAIVLDPGEAVCVARNASRDGRTVQPDVVRRQWLAVRRSVADPLRLLGEGLAAVHVLDDVVAIEGVVVVRDPSLRPALPVPDRAARRPSLGTGPAGRAATGGTGNAVSSRPSAPPDRTA